MPVLCRATLAVTCDALCSIVLEENPLADFVELPEHLQDLRCITSLTSARRPLHCLCCCVFLGVTCDVAAGTATCTAA